MLTDEPTGNLDTHTGASIIELLLALNREGTTMAVITHNLEVAAAMPRQVEVRDGLVVRDSAVLGAAARA